jgi:hypothetical protein
MADSTPSNMQNFTVNSYNLTSRPQSWCVKPGSLYTNPAANFNYFNNKCGDSYTYYSYWYRRFPNQTSYLNCYYYPYSDVELKNKWGYLKNKGNCVSTNTGVGYNQVKNGFKFYDSKINPTTARFSLTV